MGTDTRRPSIRVYRRLFDPPGTAQFAAAGFIARLTVSMSSLGLVLALTARGERGYATAGLVVGVFGLTSSLTSPYIGRLIDEQGQRRVLVPLTSVFAASMLAFTAVIGNHAPTWALVLLAALSGASMPVCGPLIRTRWANIYRGSRMLRVSYAFESVTDELVYIVGPVVVAVIATSLSTSLGLVAVVACATGGTIALALQSRTQPEPNRERATPRPSSASLTRSVPLLVVCGALFGIGGTLGSLEIITVAYAESQQHKGMAGALLGLMGVASMIAGLVFGAVRVRSDSALQLRATILAFGFGLLPLWLVNGLPALAALLFCFGLVLAPAMITCMEIVQRVATPSALTEAMTWASAAIGLGLTAGSLVGGVLVDALTPAAALRVPAGFGLAAGFVVVVSHRSMRRAMPCHRIAS